MKIELSSVSKRYAFEWIFRNIDFIISPGDRISISGPNGSGKSTFVRMLIGAMDPSVGSIRYTVNDKKVKVNEIYRHFSFAAPYTELPIDLSLREMLRFHFKFRTPILDIAPNDIAELCYLQNAMDKKLSEFSSGMLQRLKLAIAVCSQSEAIILDEPTTNLDAEAKHWFRDTLDRFLNNRTLIIATNEEEDKVLCDRDLNMGDWKKG